MWCHGLKNKVQPEQDTRVLCTKNYVTRDTCINIFYMYPGILFTLFSVFLAAKKKQGGQGGEW